MSQLADVPDRRCRLIPRLLFSLLLPFFALFAKEELPKVPPGVLAPVDTLFDLPLTRGLGLVYQDRYEEAAALFDSLQQVYPDHPAPFFYKAAVYQAWMSSYRFSDFQEALEENVQLAIDKGNELLKVREDDPWVNFYLGAAYGYRGLFRFRSFNWIGAYMDAKKGVGNFDKALEKDSTLYDVYLGFGTYHYWRTARSKFLRVIAFWMKDKRELGLEQMRFAIAHGRYAADEAAFSLFYSLFDYGQYAEAEQVLNRFMRKYPSGQQIIGTLYFQGRLKAQMEQWDEAKAIFAEILRRLEGYPYPSPGYQVECKYWIACALAAEGDALAAQKLVSEALAQSELRDKDKELESPLNGFDEIVDWLKELDKSLQKAQSG
ncbi:MAG: hypothetical protein KDH97_09025 [Calditrichaeota bacterium]|nr:hypothetical protein [Calditrichota bacterium]MCB0290383.1 hypothetical protein [Calditrichota bacterium]MCB0314616.1 hypothetical protein [Calditrichota bacterium]